MELIKIIDLHASIGEKEVIKGVNLTVNRNEIHAIMGPNGAGKTTLINVIMGNPKYRVTSGEILFEGKSILNLSVDERARLGIFQSFQYPEEISGVTFMNFLRLAYEKMHPDQKMSVLEFGDMMVKIADSLKMDHNFLKRYVNLGFSGGERKKSEILQLSALNPKIALLDETDSGLDIDALKIVSEGINNASKNGMAVVLVTHYKRILDYVKPKFVHIFIDGRIVKTGGIELAEELERNGYEEVRI
ncbi:MAG: Fe-S cluster assembly ATPase SufC [Mesoaciditoga sp.]|uniref:Fe-S cluster assembly ATPase SufC n=1 Tax=Athalassotoga sp. TaxID=2022597 RepID=UPI000CB5400C|nr:MAG: Fe-S cluster assembly ATPase SufC [Mesoaciditoga sp.]HEU24441.1 Fe-S cluster assembly ATPase SufC [Mesoaciditoga lauensis]